MAAEWTLASVPAGGAALGVGSVPCASTRGTTWSTAAARPTQGDAHFPVFYTLCVCSLFSAEPIIGLFVYLLLPPGVPPGLAVLGQQQLLIKHVHPLLPLYVQGGSHPQRALVARLRGFNSSGTDSLLQKQ